jgi:hypothetical protein
MAAVFCYGMITAAAGMCLLDGVPSDIGDGKWRDPHHVLTPETRYLLHNHSVVKKVLSKQEYDLYGAYGLAFFSGIGMLFAAAWTLGPLDRNGQLFRQRGPGAWARLARPQPPPWLPGNIRCPECGAGISLAERDQPPPWCPRCGGTL